MDTFALKRLGMLKSGAGFPIEEQGFTDKALPFYKVRDLGNGAVPYLSEPEHTISDETATKLGAYIFPAQTLVFAKVGEAVRLNRFKLLSNAACLDNNMMGYVFDKQKIHPQYLYYFSNEVIDLSLIINAGPVPSLNARQAGSISLTLPCLEEQRRIAGYLDQQCAAIDGAIAVKQQQLEKFDTLGKTVLSKAVLEGLDDNAPKRNPHSLWFSEIPARWDIRRLKDVSTMQTGITLGKDYDEPTEERPYLRVANVQDGHLALDDMKTINLPPTLIPRYELQPGDVLMTEGGDLDKLGRGYVWNNELPGCLHQNHVFALRCQPQKLLPDYLAMLTSSTHGRAYFEITGKKTTNLASTNATKVNQFPIPLPPIEEQARIVAWVKAELDKIQQARAVVSRQVEVLAEYKKSLIHECVTGKRRVVV